MKNAVNPIHLAVFSFYFGQGAEGICTRRLIESLLDSGIRITLVTSDQADTKCLDSSVTLHKVDSWPIRPQKIHSALGRLFTYRSSPFFWWAWRAARIALKGDIDAVYARMQPVSSAIPAETVARRMKVPFMLHFSDPVPSPWTNPQSNQHRIELETARKLVDAADLMTYTTAEAMAFQNRSIATHPSPPGLVIPHVAPSFRSYAGESGNDRPNFVYLGSFYGRRGYGPLLEGFSRLLSERPLARLQLVGSRDRDLLAAIKEKGLSSSVDAYSRTSDVEQFLRGASALVATDSFHGDAVFLATKVVEYLATDLPVVIVSPKASPAAKLAETMRGSVVHVSNEDPEAVASGLSAVLALNLSASAIAQRHQALASFQPSSVAHTLVCAIEGLLEKYTTRHG